MADGHRLKKKLNRHICAIVWPILMKFGMVTQIGPPTGDRPLKYRIFKNQDGGGRHLEKLQKITISPQRYRRSLRNLVS